MGFVLVDNRTFPSSCLPPLQRESKCEVFLKMKISSRPYVNRTNCHRKSLALGNGLFSSCSAHYLTNGKPDLV